MIGSRISIRVSCEVPEGPLDIGERRWPPRCHTTPRFLRVTSGPRRGPQALLAIHRPMFRPPPRSLRYRVDRLDPFALSDSRHACVRDDGGGRPPTAYC